MIDPKELTSRKLIMAMCYAAQLSKVEARNPYKDDMTPADAAVLMQACRAELRSRCEEHESIEAYVEHLKKTIRDLRYGRIE